MPACVNECLVYDFLAGASVRRQPGRLAYVGFLAAGDAPMLLPGGSGNKFCKTLEPYF